MATSAANWRCPKCKGHASPVKEHKAGRCECPDVDTNVYWEPEDAYVEDTTKPRMRISIEKFLPKDKNGNSIK